MSFDVDTLTPVEDRALPWEVSGSVDVSEARTIEEVLDLAGLNWTVSQEPVWQKMPGDRKYRAVPNRVLNIRDDTHEVMGIVTPSYNIAQNYDALSFTQELTEESAKFRHAGPLEDGRLVFVVLELPQMFEVPGDQTVKPFLLIMNAHDGYRPYSASIQIVRYFCVNQLSAAIYNAAASWKLKHTGTLHDRAAAARETLGVSTRYLRRFEEVVGQLATTKVTDAVGEMLLQKIFPVSPSATELQIERSQYAAIYEVWRTSPTLEGIRDTVWGVMNAVTEFVDHGSKYRSGYLELTEARAESILFGAAAWKKQSAFTVLSQYAAEAS